MIAYFVAADIGDPHGESFRSALAEQRFRTIETAASEEVSIGWVTAGDPTGDTFELEDLELDTATWLRMRVDTKRLPTAWLGIHRAVAERSAGRPLSVRERRELREDLCQKLLPRTLPNVQLVDALWLRKPRRVLLFATSVRLREEFEKLFFRTFAVALEQAGPYELAARAELGAEQTAYLDEVSPVPWPRDRGAQAVRSVRAERSGAAS